ncbi:hypothetical protein LIER_28384 [Lithospermum erythrorhizon]|uniref:Uncharacterized protein n=1 Tax=Lithospermum erythrorhizon TaxID=34254 RepID=A0AAV3RH49_LITER
MSEAYKKVSTGRLTFKGGDLATRSKSITKKSKKKKQKLAVDQDAGGDGIQQQASEDVYTIDPMKKMKYDELFPVECKKFGYDPKAKAASVEQALDDRVKKKADRYYLKYYISNSI